MLGWLLDIPALKILHVDIALCFTLAGLAIWFGQRKTPHSAYEYMGWLCTLAVVMLSGTRLIALLLGENHPSIDPPLSILTPLTQTVFMRFVCFTLLTPALLFLDQAPRWLQRLTQIFSVIVWLLGLLGVMMYIYQRNLLGDGAIETAILFFLTSSALLIWHAEDSPLRILLNQEMGGILIRRLLPIAILFPFITSLVEIYGQRSGLYNSTIQTILFTFSMIMMFLGVSFWVAYQTQNAAQTIQKNQTRYISTLDNMLEGCQIIGFDWRYIYVNHSAARSARIPRDSIIGHTVLEKFPHIGDTELYAAIQRCLDERIPHRAELEFMYEDGDKAWFDFSIQPVPEGVFILTLDVSQARQTHLALKTSEEKYRRIVETSKEGIWTIDTDNKLTFINPTMSRILDYPLGELIGRPFLDFIHPSEHDSVALNITQLEIGYSIQRNNKLLRKDGSIANVLTSATALTDADNQYVGALAMVTDLTQHEEIQAALKASEERYRHILENVQEGIWTVDNDDLISYANPKIAEILGYEVHEMVGQNVLQFVYHTFANDGGEIRRSLKAGKTGKRESQLICKDGSLVWVLASRAPFFDVQGRYIGMLTTMVNIDQRKKAEAALQASEERYRKLFNLSPEPMWVYELHTLQFLMVNDAAVARYGYSREEFLNMSLHKLYASRDLQRLSNSIIKASQKDYYPVAEVWEHIKKDGTVFHVEVLTTALEFENNPAYMALATDVTERIKTQEAVQDLNAKLEARVTERTERLSALNRELEAFSYSVSHDLRAPLRAIDGFSLVILEDYGDELHEDAQNYLHRIRNASKRMGHLIDDLLHLSRLSRQEMVVQPLDLSALVHLICQDLQSSDPARQVDFRIEEGLFVIADERLLRIALENLLGNAWKFTSKQPKAFIQFGSIDQDNGKIYFVRDDGPGFDMAYADKLFGAFQRLHRDTEFEGTGIGLATVQRIISRHNGKIWAESKLNQGTTFFFTV